MLTDNDIDRIGQRIVERCNPWVLGVFGSYATGLAHERSDLDLFAIIPTSQPPSVRNVPFLRALRGVMHPVDTLVQTPQEFEAAAARYMSFAWIIVRQARFLHVAPEASGLISRIEGWPAQAVPTSRAVSKAGGRGRLSPA